MVNALVVGFDLDMTLIDSRPGIMAVWDAVGQAAATHIDSAAAVTRLGPPLDHEVRRWFPDDRVDEIVELYRSHYAPTAIEASPYLPGAREALDLLRADGAEALVVSAKFERHAQAHVDHLEMPVASVVGDLFSAAKGRALRAAGARVYVGDHVHDVEAARAADCVSVGVATGPCSAEELRGAGADVVLDSLLDFESWWSGYVIEARAELLAERLRELGSVLVAFSGGADSALLVAEAARVLGPDKVVAATAVSDSLPDAERGPAEDFCDALGVRHVTPRTHEMEREGYRANAGDRCYFCKAELVDTLGPLAEELGLAHVATGTNADDVLAGFRPGIRAAAERGAVTPLRDAGFTKAQVRGLSRVRGLPTWDKPAAACLSSRIAYGVEVTPAGLARVERAEVAVRGRLAAAELALSQLRVRDLGGGTARVELDAQTLAGVEADDTIRDALVHDVRVAGFDEVEIDPRGFRSGSMNELLADPAKYR